MLGRLANKLLYAGHYAPLKLGFAIEQRVSKNRIQEKIPHLEEHRISTADGIPIETWFAANPQSQGKTKIYFHGNASSINCFSEEALRDYQNGFNICLFSYRGYSGNPGTPSREGLMADTNAVIDFLKSEKQISTENIYVTAHSLGSAVALNSLAKRLAENPQEKYAELKLLAPFLSFAHMIKQVTKIIPLWLAKWISKDWDNEEAIRVIAKNVESIEIKHGKNDKVVPISQGQKLAQIAQDSGAKVQFQELEALGHNDLIN